MSAQDILVLAEIHGDKLADISQELLDAGRKLADSTAGDVVAVVLGQAGDAVVENLAAADRILVVEDAALAGYTPAAYVDILEHVVHSETPRAVLIGNTTIGYDVAPALGARLDMPVINGCRRIDLTDGRLLVTASYFAGKLLADLEVAEGPAILTVLPGAFHATPQVGRGEVERRASPVPLEPGPVRFEQMILPEPGDVDITQNEILVAVGRGIEREENLEIAEELARVLGGELAASRPIVDQGWLPATRQVGKSGMTVKPKLYLTLGVSGAPEHLEGMHAAETIVAVNSDAAAPIFDAAHFGIEMDLFDFVPTLIETLKTRQEATQKKETPQT